LVLGVAYEIQIFLIDREIGQMHELTCLAETLLGWLRLVFASGEPDQTFVINVNSQGIHTSESDVDSQIELVTIKSQRVLDVLATNVHFVLLGDLRDLVRHDDATAAAVRVRFANPHFVGLTFYVLFEVHELLGQNVSFRDKTEVFSTVHFS
jgi:hypothetical protein